MKPGVLAAGTAIVAFLVWRRRKLEPTLLVGGALAALACALIGLGIVPVPNVEKIVERIGQALGTWTYLFVGVMAFLETGAFVGLLAPGETVVLVGGVVAGQGEIDLLTLIAITWACAVAGDITSLYLGRRLGRGFLERHGPRFGITEERLQAVEGYFDRYGGPTILIGRFLGLVRALAPFVAGASQMPLRRFLPYDVIAAGLWAATFCVLGYVFSSALGQVTKYAGTGALALGTVVALVVGLVLARRIATDDAYRARVQARLDRSRPGRALLAVARPVWHRVARPARFVWNRLTPGELGLELTTLVAIVAVGGFAFVFCGTQPAARWDARAFDLADRVRTHVLDDVASVVTRAGSLAVSGALLALAAGWALLRRRAVDAVTLVAGLLALVAAVEVALAAYDRPRPAGSLVTTFGPSFPSSHSAYATGIIAAAVVLVRGGANWAVRFALVTVAVVLAVAVATGRVYLRASHLTDALGGLGLGAAVLGAFGILGVIVAFVRDNGRSA